MVFSWILAVSLAAQLDPAALIPLYRQALAEKEKQFGPDHPKVARSASDLGLYLRNMGDRDGAARYLNRALQIDAKSLDGADPLVGQDLENLASVATPGRSIATPPESGRVYRCGDQRS